MWLAAPLSGDSLTRMVTGMPEQYIPLDAHGEAGNAEACQTFMLRCILKSRLESGLPSHEDGHEEDVNVYLSHLLAAYANPSYCMRVGGYISPNDTTVFETAQHSPSKRFRYRVYRVNADHLMMSIGVFQNPSGRRPHSRPHLEPTAEQFVGRAKAYYDFASSYSLSVFGRTSSVTGVLGKLADGLERYLRVLAHLRGEYFDFVDRMSDGELYHLDRAAQAEGVQVLHDQFLDLYSEYKRTGSTAAWEQLRALGDKLSRVDPSFRFDTLQ